MIKVEVQSAQVSENHIPARDGKPARIMRKQTCYLWTGGAYPLTTSVMLGDTQPAYAAGTYSVDPASFESGKFGQVSFNLRIGQPLPADIRKSA